MSARVVHKIERFFLFVYSMYVCVCGCVLANKSFRLLSFFHTFEASSLFCTLYRISRTLFRVGLNLATFRILCLKTCVSCCLFVGSCVCVCVCLWNRVLCCLFCLCLCTRQILRGKTFSPQNVKLLFQGGRVKMALLC